MPLSQNNNHTFVSGELVTSAKLNSTKIIQSDTEANNDNFTGNPGQLTYDSTNKKLRLHDGQTAGGLEVTPAQSSVSLGAGSVTENMLATGAVTNTKLATDSVTEEKILDGAVTASKLADDAISLGAGSVTSEMLADGAIESIDDIGDVQTAGTGHTPSDGDALVWNDTHSHWMPGGVATTNSAGGTGVARAVFCSTGGSPGSDSIHAGTTPLGSSESYRDVRPSSFNIKDSTWIGTSTGQHWVHFITPIENPVIIIPDFQWSYNSNTGQANISQRITTYGNTSPFYNLTFDSQGRLTKMRFSGTYGTGSNIGLAIRHFVIF